jgi:hypothetical protein
MTIFSPQALGTTSGAGRRKIKSPYVDLIRGQYGQATENVLAQRQQQQIDVDRASTKKFQRGQLALDQQSLALQKDQAKQAGKMGMIGTGISAVGAGVNAYNALGGSKGIKSGLSDFGKWLGSFNFLK